MDRMSTKRKAPSLPLSHFKDTFKLLSDRNEDAESISSSIPEMSKLEEHQLKRSFQAIQAPETPTPPQEDDFSGRSNPLFQDEDGTKNTTEKDESDSDEEQFRRARRSGLVSSQQSSFTEVNPRNSMSPSLNMEEQFESETNPKYTAQWENQTTTPESSVHIIPQVTRTRTPDATASRGHLVVGSFGSDKPAINKPNLGYTMRDKIKDMNQHQETTFTTQPKKAKVTNPEPSTSTSFMKPTTSTSPLGKTTRDGIRSIYTNGATPNSAPRYTPTEHERPQRMEEDMEKDDDDEKRGPCLPRCAVVGVFLAILFGSIVALIVLVDENRKQEKNFGMVFPDPITFHVSMPTIHVHVPVKEINRVLPKICKEITKECPNIKLNLTKEFRIKCMFDFSHPQHRDVENVDRVIIHKPNGTNEDGPIDFIEGNWTSEEITATCATIGTYSISFGSKHVFMLNVTLEEPTVNVSIEQRFFNDTSGSSQFITNCSVYGDCTNYQANVVGVRGSNQDILTENKTCTIEHSNTAGIRTQCMMTIPDSIAGSYTGLKCRLSADGTIRREKNFNLPPCGLRIECPTGRVNCTEGAADRLDIDQCQLSTFINECFYPGRTFHSYCIPGTNQCSCVLNWCEHANPTTLIGLDRHPGFELCGSEFEPSNFTASPPTTTTTATTTTVVTTP